MPTFRTGEGGEGMQDRHRTPLRGRTSCQALCMPRLTLKELNEVNEVAAGCQPPACPLYPLSVGALPFWRMCVEPAYIFALFVSSMFTALVCSGPFLHASHISDSMRAPFHEFWTPRGPRRCFWDFESRQQGCFRMLY